MNTSIESNAEEDDWKNGSFVVTKSAVKERRKVYSGTTTFDGLTIKTSKVPWEYSDLHFIEGNEYVIDSNSIEIVPIISEVSYTSINVGKVSEAYIDNSIARFGLTTSAQDNKTFIYSSPSSFVNYIDAYIRVSGTSSFKGSISYELESDYTYTIQYQINFKYQGEMDNERKGDILEGEEPSHRIAGTLVLDCSFDYVGLEFSKESLFSSSVRYRHNGAVEPPSKIFLDSSDGVIGAETFFYDYLFMMDLIVGHEYRIESVTPSFIDFRVKNFGMESGTVVNSELIDFEAYGTGNTFVFENPEDDANYLDFPISVTYTYLIDGDAAQSDSGYLLSGNYDLSCTYYLNLQITDLTELAIWEEEHPDEEYPEGDLITPGPDGTISGGSSDSSGSVNLTPITEKIDSSTAVVVEKIDTTTTTLTETLNTQSQKITLELEEQSNMISNKFDEQKQEMEEQTHILEEQKENEKNFFGSFFENLIETIKGLFVPSEEEMQSLLDELMTFFSDKFGFLFFPFELLGQALEIFQSDGTTGITFPGFSIMGYEVWPDLTYDIASNEIADTVFEYVRYATGAMLAMWFINYLRNFFDKRFGGGGN